LGLVSMVMGTALFVSCECAFETEALPGGACPLIDQKEGNRLDLTKNSAVLTARIPPIDASAPAKTETATFALG